MTFVIFYCNISIASLEENSSEMLPTGQYKTTIEKKGLHLMSQFTWNSDAELTADHSEASHVALWQYRNANKLGRSTI